MRIFKITLLIIALILAIDLTGFLAWANTPLAAMPEALTALQSDSQVTVTENGRIVFQPSATQPDTGLILYLGYNIRSIF